MINKLFFSKHASLLLTLLHSDNIAVFGTSLERLWRHERALQQQFEQHHHHHATTTPIVSSSELSNNVALSECLAGLPLALRCLIKSCASERVLSLLFLYFYFIIFYVYVV